MSMRDWDVTSGPGLTALGLAAARVVESGMRDRLIEDPYAVAFLAAVDSPVSFPVAWPAVGEPVSDQHALFLHGSRYIGVRSRYYDDYLSEAVTRTHVRQVVIIGAGLDTRAYRMRWPEGLILFELEQQKILHFKDSVLDARPVGQVLVGVDLRDDWSAPLIAAGFDPDRPTAWMAEGVLAYLDGHAQQMLLERLHALAALESSIALDRLAPPPPGGDDRLERLTERSGMAMDEMLHTAVAFNPADWLGRNGWSIVEERTETIADRYGRDLADPFTIDRNDPASEPPWLDTVFVSGHRAGRI